MICKHCNGTGELPDKLKLECVQCQKPVLITFDTTTELVTKALNVQCVECKRDFGELKG